MHYQSITAVLFNRYRTQWLSELKLRVTAACSVWIYSPFWFGFQITQLKIASNPFAKGFRDCDPEDWWAFTLKQYSLTGMFPHGAKVSASALQNSFAICFTSQVPDGWSLPHKRTQWVPWSLEITGYCLKVNRLCFSVIDKWPDAL